MKTYTFKEQFTELVLEFLWRQWSAVGVAGHAQAADNRIIDPEALLLLTSRFGRYEPRLFDEVLDWLQQEAQTLNLQRLKNLSADYQFGDPGVLAAIAGFLGTRAPHQKWRQLARELSQPSAEPEALFFEVPTFGAPDPIFLQYGWKREQIDLRGLGSSPNPKRGPNFIFKLRALFGLQARAEILACLLCSDVGRPADIATLTGYFPRTVQITLNEMTRSGHVFSARDGREKHFWVKRDEWRFLADWPGNEFPHWMNWPPLFAMLDAVGGKLQSSGFDSAPMAIQSMELRSVLELAIPRLLGAGLPIPMQTSPTLGGETLLESLLSDFRRFLR